VPQFSVNIINSLGQTIRRTTEKSVRKMLNRGLVRPHGHAYELITDDHRVRENGYAPRPYYTNGIGFATREAIKGIPAVGGKRRNVDGITRLLTGHRPAEPPRDIEVRLLTSRIVFS